MADSSESQAKKVIYCKICSFPPEYCEFGPTPAECKAWVEKEHPDLFHNIYETTTETAAPVRADLESKAAHAQEKLEKQHAAAAAKAATALAAAKITITEVERSKRKHVTVVTGVEDFGMDLKKTAKEFGKKFATGSSVTKKPSGGEEITIQGEVGDEVKEWLVEKAGVKESQVDVVQGKKK